MKIIIAGAGRLGAQIAQVLSAAHNDIVLIEVDEGRLAELGDSLTLGDSPTVRLVAGDACDPDILEHAGALTADLLVAVTGSDEDNLVISLLAKRRFAVPRVAARVNNADNAWLFDHRWGIDVPVPGALPLVSLIEEATGAADTVALLRLSKAGVNVVETAITSRSRASGRALADIALPEGTVIAALIRDGQPTVPTSQTRLRPGDELLLVSHTATDREIHAAFQ